MTKFEMRLYLSESNCETEITLLMVNAIQHKFSKNSEL